MYRFIYRIFTIGQVTVWVGSSSMNGLGHKFREIAAKQVGLKQFFELPAVLSGANSDREGVPNKGCMAGEKVLKKSGVEVLESSLPDRCEVTGRLQCPGYRTDSRMVWSMDFNSAL